jgi:hypothetical protein
MMAQIVGVFAHMTNLARDYRLSRLLQASHN